MHSAILLVDDDEMVRTVIQTLLSAEGHRVVVAAGLQPALALLAGEAIDLVLTDIRMPGGSGLLLLHEVRGKYPEIHVILMTGFPEVSSVQAALRQGAFDYLLKPILPEELLRVVGHALEHKRFREEREQWRNRLEALFQGVGESIIILDQAGEIIQMNEAAIALLGGAAVEQGGRLRDRLPWLQEAVMPLLQEAVQQGRPIRSVQKAVDSPQAGEQILSCSAAPFHDPVSRSTGTVLVIRDESRYVALEKENLARQGLRNTLIGASRPMREVHELLEQLAEVDSTVLISGETGTGKEIVARQLHALSTRCQAPFVAINCAALPSGLLESELFGHAKGAFTNAIRDKPGRFLLADHGTLFLDEIGDLPLELQVRLLRVLQEKSFEPVGDHRTIKVDVRLVAASNRDLKKSVEAGQFREDLYYRLKVVEVHLPPLRERKPDIPLLLDHFLHQLNLRFGRSVRGVSDEVLRVLMEYDWPGNVRELEHGLEHAMVVCRQPLIELNHLPAELRSVVARPAPPQEEVREEISRETLLQVLVESGGQIKFAASKLGISRSTLWRRMKACGLHDK